MEKDRSQSQQLAAERGILISCLGKGGARTYKRLRRRYGHETLWKAFSAPVNERPPRWAWIKLRILFGIRRWRERAESFATWLQLEN